MLLRPDIPKVTPAKGFSRPTIGLALVGRLRVPFFGSLALGNNTPVNRSARFMVGRYNKETGAVSQRLRGGCYLSTGLVGCAIQAL